MNFQYFSLKMGLAAYIFLTIIYIRIKLNFVISVINYFTEYTNYLMRLIPFIKSPH